MDKVEIEITAESAEALALVASLKTTWDAAPTMVRGAPRVPGALGKPDPAPKKKASVLKDNLKKKNDTKGYPEKKKKKHHLVGENDEKEVDLSEKDFRRNDKGSAAIRTKMTQMLQLDQAAFVESPSFHLETMKCRIKDDGAQNLVWDEFLEAAPNCLSTVCLAGKWKLRTCV